MAVRPYRIERFGGLVLDREPDEVGANESLDCLNVDLDKRGGVRVRDGYTKFNASANPVSFSALYPWPGQTRLVGSGSDNKIYSYNSLGTLTDTSSAYSSSIKSVAPFGTGTTSYLYLAQGTGGSIVRLTTAGAFSQPAGMPSASYIAVQPNDNRLAAANTSAGSSRVQFSDPGDAETWGANNYVDLTPNDGETIVALVVWRDFLFVFKQTKFFVFYGNSTDSTGNPVFNYRTVNIGVGAARSTTAMAAVAAPDGLYFMGLTGVYRTTGGPPESVSGEIGPLFSQAAFFAWPLLNPPLLITGNFKGCCYFSGRLFFIVPDGSNRYIFVYDINTRAWLVWKTGHAPTGIVAFIATNDELKLRMSSGTQIYTFDIAVTSDDGTVIASRYRSGFYAPLGDPARECTVRESIIDGIGTPTFSVSRDFAASLPTSGGGAKATVTLGTSSTIAQGRHRLAQRGRRFSYQIEATSGAWRVESITQNLTGFRETGLKTT